MLTLMKTKRASVKIGLLFLLLFILSTEILFAQQDNLTMTVLLTDISGSMDEVDASGIIKLEAAKSAAGAYLDAIQAEQINSGGTQADLVSLITFCKTAQITQPFIQDLNQIRNSLSPLQTCGNTDLYSGIQKTIDEIDQIHQLYPDVSPAVILLTDGVPTISPNLSNAATNILQQEVLGLLPALKARNACLYVIPLGDPTAPVDDERFVDLAFLQQMVSIAGCGQVFENVTAAQLAQIYLKIRVVNDPIIIGETKQIYSSQNITIEGIITTINQSYLRIDVSWTVGNLDVLIYDPSGRLVDASYPGASIAKLDHFTQIIIQNPAAGQWSGEIQAVNVPSTGSWVTVLVSGDSPTTPAANLTPPISVTPSFPQPGGNSDTTLLIGLVLILLTFFAGVIAILMRQQSNRQSPSPSIPGGSSAGHRVLVLDGMSAGQSTPLLPIGVSIGRRSGNNLVLYDNQVSRDHARVIFNNGYYYIQDLNSSSGTFVNGQHIRSMQIINPGDRIKIGNITLLVE